MSILLNLTHDVVIGNIVYAIAIVLILAYFLVSSFIDGV